MSATALSLLLLISVSAAAAQVFTREDGKCGVIDGVETGCEHIPPFPTCCQENGHCGWDCDGSETNQLPVHLTFSFKFWIFDPHCSSFTQPISTACP